MSPELQANVIAQARRMIDRGMSKTHVRLRMEVCTSRTGQRLTSSEIAHCLKLASSVASESSVEKGGGV